MKETCLFGMGGCMLTAGDDTFGYMGGEITLREGDDCAIWFILEVAEMWGDIGAPPPDTV